MSLKIEDIPKYMCRNGEKPVFTSIEFFPSGEPKAVIGFINGERKSWGWERGTVKHQSSDFDLLIIKSLNPIQ